jgi:inner membrane protein
MDIVTHALVGVALSRAGFQRFGSSSAPLLILAATIPDIDVIAHVAGPLAALEYRCGYTHALLALPILALACAGMAALIPGKKLPLSKAWLIACVGVASHLLLDWTGSIGLRMLLPFSSRWFYLDLNASYDGAILLALGLALVWPWFVNLVSGEIGESAKNRGQGSALAVLLFLLVWEGARWSLHERALNGLNSRMYDGETATAVAALADPNNPLAWTGIVETTAAFRILKIGSLDIGDATDARISFKPEKSAAYLAAMNTEPFRYMAYFARFPIWRIEPAALDGGMGKALDMTDVRFEAQGTRLSANAVTDDAGHLLFSNFGVRH